MATSVLGLQKDGVLRMLNIGTAGDQQSQWGGAQTWKVLIYDKFCFEVVAPLLKVGSLRNHGVSLNVSLDNPRGPLPHVPAVYFVEPTVDNVQKILDDLTKGLYESCYINFASSVPRSLLEEFAKGALQANAAQKVAGIFDRYVSFVSLSHNLFSLNLPRAYQTLHSPMVADDVMMAYIERIVDGLLSVLVTMRALPVIRCPPGEASEMVARRLEERIRELLARSGGSDLFSGGGIAAAGSQASALDAAGAANQRPLLCIVDRDVDLVTMLHHTWTYQAMVQDVLGMRLNKVTVPVDSADADKSQPPKPKAYDVDESDSFWTSHGGDPFPEVTGAISEAIEEYEKKRQEMSKTDAEAESLAPGLAAAINALPEMTEKKRSIDMHTNIATALMDEIKARGLDMYYEVEDQFSQQGMGAAIAEVEKLLAGSQKGTTLDKTRALMVLYLTKPSLTSAQLSQLTDALAAIKGDVSGISYLQHLASIRSMSAPIQPQATLLGGPAGASAGSVFGNLGKLAAKGEGLLSAGMKNIKNIVASKKELVICQVLDTLMEHKPGGVGENYIYLDPKAPAGAEPARIRKPFQRAVAFVLGGGNYAEMQALQEWSAENGRQVAYGSTDIVSAEQFVDELADLGYAQSSMGADLR